MNIPLTRLLFGEAGSSAIGITARQEDHVRVIQKYYVRK